MDRFLAPFVCVWGDVLSRLLRLPLSGAKDGWYPPAEPVPDFTVLHAALAPYVHDSVEAKMRPEDIIRAQEFSKQCIESSYAQALFGWQSGAQSQRYTRTANKRTLAQRAAQRLSGKP